MSNRNNHSYSRNDDFGEEVESESESELDLDNSNHYRNHNASRFLNRALLYANQAASHRAGKIQELPRYSTTQSWGLGATGQFYGEGSPREI